jgi:N-sulfoglucosamine sulfohydrolase
MKLISALVAAVLCSLGCHGLTHAAAPNVLIIMSDDSTYNDLSLYGGQNARTPNIASLAAEGLTFDRAYLAMSMCQPCRAELYTGQYPMRNGCAWNHSACRPGTRSLPHYLGSLGYRVGLAGKVHVLPANSFPFEKIAGFETRSGANPTIPHQLDQLREFISRGDDEPFCSVVALVDPHVPWVMGDAAQYPPKQIKLPPNIADTPKTREDFASYLAEITYMDGQVGDILTALQESGLADETLVLFTSEQGSQFPGNKWTNWDTGLHTALIARWPGKVPQGKRTDALVQYADVAPTLVQLAGGDPTDQSYAFDGTSFAAVLQGGGDHHREFVFGIHNNIPEGPPYPTRSISDGHWRYIRNLAPDELYIEKHLMGHLGGGALTNVYWPSWVATAWENPDSYRLVKRYMSRPAEELYHTASDTYEMNNLASDAAHAAIKAKLSSELDRWLASQGDPGIPLDTHQSHQAAKRGNHAYVPPQP